MDPTVAAHKAGRAAETADDAVVELIRTELQGKGQPLGDWQAFAEPDPARDRSTEGSRSDGPRLVPRPVPTPTGNQAPGRTPGQDS